ncbi:MAG: bifunctional glutamate N-acetyltransferase/amino-acid acetyltransferase ArgJ [bacterium]|nr:bifunctional glutamate N-acetyltransferase/amino-acid acetyltransferase ArgJ [bacterium]
MNVIEDRFFPPQGFQAAGIACGLKPNGARDVALLVSDRPASAAGMFTTNRVQAAPIQVNREHLQSGTARAIVVNSKNANACTGEQGVADARTMARIAAEGLGIEPEDVLVNSTGVIGVPLPLAKLGPGIGLAVEALRPDGWDDASQAIMTTDTVPKKASVSLQIQGKKISICGMAKGAGMIAPNMATMLAFLATDASVSPEHLSACLKTAVAQSFNCVTVDGDMSTNDTVLILANGAASSAPLEGKDLDTFQEALNAVCASLARQIARDGEGATKLITIHVTGAETYEEARTVGLSVANSSLVKTAVFGRDPNWGRILCAVGYSGAPIQPDHVTVSMAGISIFRDGSGVPFDRKQAIEFQQIGYIPIDIDLGTGTAEATIYTCDLTYEYIKVNAEYTT